jgi:hypothetical protein
LKTSFPLIISLSNDHEASNRPSGVSKPPSDEGIPVLRCGEKFQVLPWVDVTVNPRR